MVDAATLAFAFGLGLGTFFSPCAVALVPSYVAYFAGTRGRVGVWAGLRFGAWAAAGVFAIFAVAAGALYLIRIVVRVPASVLDGGAIMFGLLVGAAFMLLGVLVLAGRGPSWAPRVNAVLERTPGGMFAWGALFGVGSLGCSLPLALAALALAFSEGAGGALVLLAYAAGLAGLVLAAGPVIALAGPSLASRLPKLARPIQMAMGVVLAAGGVYVVWYYAQQL